MTEPRAPGADPAHTSAVRDLLRRVGYTRDGVQGALGATGDVLARVLDRPLHLRRVRGREGALETLIRLFVLDDPVDADEAERTLAPTPVDSLVALRLVDELDGAVVGRARIVPHGTVIIASDLPAAESGADLVAGIHRPSITLADLTIRRPVRSALDMGTGNGIQAILASRHAERVVATDINERALAFATLNAALNGVDNIEFRPGSFFEPVAGERFGLVVTNPPYVISPESAFLFRDSGMGRDRVSEQLVGELPAFLEEGGHGTIMVSWVLAGDDISARPRSWLEGNGCDAWILHTGREDHLTAAAGWNRDRGDDPEGYAAAIDRWEDYFRREGIDAIAYGGLIMRRRTEGGPNWIRHRELPSEPRRQPEYHLLRLFSGVDVSSAHPDDSELADLRVALASGAMITTRLRFDEGEWSQAAELNLERGIPFTAELDRSSAELIVGLDGRRALGEVLDTFAAEHDAPRERVRASGLGVVREMLEMGFAEVPAEEVAERH